MLILILRYTQLTYTHTRARARTTHEYTPSFLCKMKPISTYLLYLTIVNCLSLIGTQSTCSQVFYKKNFVKNLKFKKAKHSLNVALKDTIVNYMQFKVK